VKDEQEYYSEAYWYNNPTEHADVDNYGENYYAYKIYQNVILKISDIPTEGYIILLGTNRCVSFDLLCRHFGADRCIGFDVHNPTNHPCVTIKDCNLLSPLDDIPIAFCHNDLGSFPTTPKLKIHGQEWATSNIIKGGYFLGRNNLNCAKFKSEEFMTKHGFVNYHFADMQNKYDMSTLDSQCVEGHMLSQKIK
tara:strand:+ start:6307 stop:6888 length:582 start_codon:yes stop_codon:yes gene_type:complete